MGQTMASIDTLLQPKVSSTADYVRKSVLWLALALVGLGTLGMIFPQTAQAACDPPDLLMVLDKSGSMASDSKWTHAVNAIKTITNTYNGKLAFGLITFDSSAYLNYSIVTCRSDGSKCVANLQAKLAQVGASGGTNLQAALNLAITHLTQVKAADSVPARKRSVMFITDGQATCAQAQASSLLSTHNAKTYVIGFGAGVDGTCLTNMATSGGTARATTPKYYQANDNNDLNAAMKEIADAASTEVCNGADDDCDGYIDNIPGTKQNNTLTQACSGNCGPGTQICTNGKWGACSTQRQPSPEVCNNVDDDCNGKIDDGLQRTCTSACGKGVETCDKGQWVGCTAPQPKAEECNNKDDDCDGKIDGNKRPCKTICGAGEEVCTAGQWGNCTAPNPEKEICDGKDNDCNGQIDENLTQSCNTSCGSGTETCDKGKWINCTGPKPEAEVCDGKDNDCNGKVDDGLSRACRTICGTGQEMCVNGNWEQCNAPTPQTEVCNGRDDDCNGNIDDVQPSADCPKCVSGLCYRACTQECPTGFRCVNGACVEHPCSRVKCGLDEICKEGTCTNVCQGVQCKDTELCVKGQCVAKPANNDCTTIGCPNGQLCEKGKCVADPCAGVACQGRNFCRDGQCVETCSNVQCNTGSSCKDGKCVEDPCTKLKCKDEEVCKDGKCIEIPQHPCYGVTCGKDEYCQEGKCVSDPCLRVTCPANDKCYKGQCYGGSTPPPEEKPLPQPDGNTSSEGGNPGEDGGNSGTEGSTTTEDATNSESKLPPNSPDDENKDGGNTTNPPNPDGTTKATGCLCHAQGNTLPLGTLLLVFLLFLAAFALRYQARFRG